MDIKCKNVSLIKDTYAYIGRVSSKENAEEFKIDIQEYVNELKEIISTDFNKLSDEDLYKLLTKFYSIRLDEDDYLKMLSKYNNKQYTCFHRIPTTITFYEKNVEGQNRNFDWWKKQYQIYYLAALSDDIEYDFNKTYSKEEIKKMLGDKSIVILKQEIEPIEDTTRFKKESFESIPTLNIDIKEYDDNISGFVLNNFYLFGELLRKKFTKRRVLKDIREFISNLDQDIEDIFSEIKSQDYLYSNIAKTCKNWFDASDEKKEYENIQKKLKIKKDIK